MSEPIDLDDWTPEGKSTVDYAVELLRSHHLAEVASAESWLLEHPDLAVPALVAALATPAAQPAATLLGVIGGDAVIDELRSAHRRGGEGLRAAVEQALAANGSPAARAALADLPDTT